MEFNLSRRDGMALQTNIYKAESKIEKLIEELETDGRTIAANCVSNLLEGMNLSAELIEFRNSEFVREMLDTNNLENKIKKIYNKELGIKTLDEAIALSVMHDEIFSSRPEEYKANNMLKGLCESYKVDKNEDGKFIVMCEGKITANLVNELSRKTRDLKEDLNNICTAVYPEYKDFIISTYSKLNLLNTLVDNLC